MSTMIDTRGWKATFKAEHGTFSEPLMFWVLEESGPVGCVLSEQTGRPRSAERAANFDGYEQDEEADDPWWALYALQVSRAAIQAVPA